MSLPRMSWHIGDYKKDTGHLRAPQHGAYFLLCMHYWATGGLPDDDKQLATIACMTDREWKATRPIIEPLFKGEGKWKHKRVEEELIEAQEKYEKLSKAGRDGNAKRWGSQKPSPGDRPAIPDAMAMGSQPITLSDKEEQKDAALTARELLGHWPAWVEIAKTAGTEIDDPNWFAQHGRVAQWLANGWDLNLDIVPTIARVVANRAGKTPIRRLEFFEGAIADAHASRTRPVPIGTPEKPHGKAPANNVIAAADRLVERIAEFNRPAPRDELPDIPECLDRRGELRRGTG